MLFLLSLVTMLHKVVNFSKRKSLNREINKAGIRFILKKKLSLIKFSPLHNRVGPNLHMGL